MPFLSSEVSIARSGSSSTADSPAAEKAPTRIRGEGKCRSWRA